MVFDQLIVYVIENGCHEQEFWQQGYLLFPINSPSKLFDSYQKDFGIHGQLA